MKKLIALVIVITLIFTACNKPTTEILAPPVKKTQDSAFIADSLSTPNEYKFILNILKLTNSTVDSMKVDHGMKQIICSLPDTTSIDFLQSITKNEEVMEFNHWSVFANNNSYLDVHVTFFINNKLVQIKVRDYKTGQKQIMFFHLIK